VVAFVADHDVSLAANAGAEERHEYRAGGDRIDLGAIGGGACHLTDQTVEHRRIGLRQANGVVLLCRLRIKRWRFPVVWWRLCSAIIRAVVIRGRRAAACGLSGMMNTCCSGRG
jgi:hypothetical protein